MEELETAELLLLQRLLEEEFARLDAAGEADGQRYATAEIIHERVTAELECRPTLNYE